jgi:acyl-CoA synthetase (AMP-forming)/AMP-acid ligase II
LTLIPRFDLDGMLQHIADERVTLAFGAAPIAVAMANHPDLERYDLSSLRYMMWAATPITEDVARRVTERTGIRWLGAYGATEVPGLHCNPVDYPDRCRLDTPGLPVSDLEVRIVDLETHKDVAPGAEGEIVVRGPHMMAGYLPPEADEGVFLDGFVRTGDVGWVEPEGWIHITDRAKEMIKVSGFSVSPAEIEATLHAHPAVADCGVYGVPHPTKGEAPKAAVVLAAEDAVTDDELRAYVADQLAGYKHVEEFVFVDVIPRTESGKVLRRELKVADMSASAAR